ncbi:hypothetical protein SAY86_011943 [Trapa natans]|uniref:Uncharacterized protein n=1 Tax=Trapa natans TaxID=22666 RepID=A0AAN7LZ43_TRANT|nr:hypothetical protein SAY86_011943 [Trapa natans]
MVHSTCGSSPGGSAEGAGLGLRPRDGRLPGHPERRSLLRAGNPLVPRLLRFQQLLPEERKLRHCLQLWRNRRRNEDKPKLWEMRLFCIRFELISTSPGPLPGNSLLVELDGASSAGSLPKKVMDPEEPS